MAADLSSRRARRLDLLKIARLDFEAPDPLRFPALRLAGIAQVEGNAAQTAANTEVTSLKAELDLRAGRVDAAAEQLEHARALAIHLGDPCWEGMAARGLGLLSAARGDQPGATAWLTEAHTRCNRTTDRYQWVSAHVLDAEDVVPPPVLMFMTIVRSIGL